MHTTPTARPAGEKQTQTAKCMLGNVLHFTSPARRGEGELQRGEHRSDPPAMQTVKISPLTATSSQSVSNTHWSHWGSLQGKAVLRRRGQTGSHGVEIQHSKPRTRMETCRALLPWSSISMCLSVPCCTSLPKKYCSPERAQISVCQADGPIPPLQFKF